MTSDAHADARLDPAATVDLATLLAGPRHALRTQVRELLGRPGFEPVADWPTHAHRARVLGQLQQVAGTAAVTAGFPAGVGGDDDVAGFVTAFEEFGLGDVSLQVKIGVQFGLFGGAVQHLGTARHHERFLPGVLDLSVLGCFAMTETGHGSDVQALGTTATHDPASDTFVLDTPGPEATKDYIGNAALHARWAVVFAQLRAGGAEHGVHALAVRVREDDGTPVAGVRLSDDGHKLGLNGVDNGRLAFDGVRVPRDQLLDRFASVAADGTYTSPIEDPTRRFFTMLGTLVQGRVAVAGAGIGAARLASTIAIKHGGRRTQFAAPGDDAPEVTLLDYLAHQQRLLPRLARTYALHAAQQELVADLDAVFTGAVTDERARRQLETRAAGQKALATRHATDTVQAAREATGGFGYLSENRLGQLKSDTDVFTTFEGANTVLLQLVAKALLTQYAKEFGSLDLLGTARFVAEQAVDVVVERIQGRSLLRSLVDAVDGREEEVSVLERGWQVQLFEQREEHVLATLAQRLRRLTDERGAFDAFNLVQDHVLLAAEAHVERVVLDAFVRMVEACEDPVVATVLDDLCSLHALTVIRDERGWFQEHGFLTAVRAKAVVAAVNGLCRRLRPDAEALVDAFGIPDELLRAPIALRHVDEPYLDARARLVEDGVLASPAPPTPDA